MTNNRPAAPPWLNLGAVVDETTIEELAAVAAEAQAIEPQIQALAIRAFRVLMTVERGITKQVNLGGHGQALLDEIDACSGARAARDAVRRLAHHLDAGRLDPPAYDPDAMPVWWAEESTAAGYPGGPTDYPTGPTGVAA